MKNWEQVSYTYDGTFNGFLTCVYESYVNQEWPAAFVGPNDDQLSIFPERNITTHAEHARRVLLSFPKKLGADATGWVTRGFLTCLPEKELHLFRFIDMGYERGPSFIRDLTDDRVAVLGKALTHMMGESHLLRGFVRFSEQGGVLVAEIEPKNRVLPILRTHFCARYSGERFIIYDRTYHEALFYQPKQWAIVPLEEFAPAAPSQEERDYRALWRRFYDTIAIEGRYNPKCRMTHMPKRYWHMMTEFREDTPSQSASLTAPPEGEPEQKPPPRGEVARRSRDGEGRLQKERGLPT